MSSEFTNAYLDLYRDDQSRATKHIQTIDSFRPHRCRQVPVGITQAATAASGGVVREAFSGIRDQTFPGGERISFAATGLLTATTELCNNDKLIEELLRWRRRLLSGTPNDLKGIP